MFLISCAGDPLSVDEQINTMVSQRSDLIGGDAAAPSLVGKVLEPLKTGGQAEARPPTVNPGASELRFVPADEARDVAARLSQFAEQSGVPIGPSKGAGAEPAKGAGAEPGAAVTVLGLNDALRVSQKSGRELLTQQEDYLLSAIRLLAERHLWGPRFFNDTTVGIAGTGDDGRFDSAATLINELRATQRLPYGGSVEAAWVWDATEQLREQATGSYTQSSEIVLSGNVPLLRGAGLVAREGLIQAERDLVYQARDFERFRREYLVSIANDYFQLLETRATIANQERQISSLETLDRATKARAEAGRLEAFRTSITSNQVLRGIATLASLREQYILQLERFKIRLGLPLDAPFVLSEVLPQLPEPRVDLAEATRAALEYRLDLQNSRDGIDDQRRAVANAKNSLLPDLTLAGRVGVPTDPDTMEGGASFSSDDLSYSASATFGLPLDRRLERLALRSELIRLQQGQRNYEQERDRVVVSVRASLRAVELSRFQLRLADQQVEISQRALRGQKLQEAIVDPQTIVDSENDLLNAENDRDRARTDLRNAVLNYLLESGLLRVERDGTLKSLPGME